VTAGDPGPPDPPGGPDDEPSGTVRPTGHAPLAVLVAVGLLLGWLLRVAALAAHQAVNRLVLGKTCALVGALLLGGYAGYALAQLGVGTPAAQERLLRSSLAALAALAMTGAALLLEHACRVREPRR